MPGENASKKNAARKNSTAPGGCTTFGAPAGRPETLTDRAEFLTGGLVPLQCSSCGTGVLVKKHSPKHTSIQWTTSPAESCPIYAERLAGGGRTALFDTCERLAASIAQAVTDGKLKVGTDDRE
ncbi:hypothetical protein [Hoyosella subflava]|uniref:Uncharacterized protein n=1 Tax=Hoyosella subflava (strain DSM 45089 / JCM 17490 / NBRC 109087 / DQS3-9A1) TaxID=443218 RepID=F6EN56_HOYSD|nr:hypothetical protein [Hoyosella subflava]AEF39373.1 hypothetical protein AS9A_0921 [Hoyosella subflava DQS3-9A1]